MSEESKEATIKKIYEHPDSGYGSITDTFKQAKKVNLSIKYVDVKEYLDKLKHRQTQFQYKKHNSFVSPHPLFEIEIDLVDLTSKAEENDGFRYGFVGIDNFTKYAWVVPIKTKQPHDVTKAMQERFDKIGVPKQLYSDQEGSFNNVEFIRLINKHKIKHIQVMDKAHTVERFNRTLKENIYKRLNAMGLDTDKWTSQLEAVVNKYNNTEHSTTKLTPHDARKDGNKLTVSFNIWVKSKRERVYPELKVGDAVRVMLSKDSKTKGYMAKWSKDIYKVIVINEHDYIVNNDRRKVYQRHELLKVV
jgi:hypothetical protein